jgi:predicted ester cyclase
MRFTVEDVVGDGDRVVVRWTQEGKHSGLLGPATAGKAFKVGGMNLFRMAGGHIAELWVVSDDLGELEQIGALQRPRGW